MTANTCQLVGKGYIDGTEGVLYHFGHLCTTDVCYDNLALTETCIVFFYLLTDFLGVSSNRSVVVKEFIHHIAGNDTLWSMNKVQVFTYLEAISLNHRTDEIIHSTRAYRRFNHYGCSLGAYLHYLLDGSNYIACVNFL